MVPPPLLPSKAFDLPSTTIPNIWYTFVHCPDQIVDFSLNTLAHMALNRQSQRYSDDRDM